LQSTGTDIDAIKACLDGDENAYARLMEGYEAQIFAQMWRFTRDRRVLDELVQDVLVEVYLSLANYRESGPFLHWVRRIATRVGYRHWKLENRARQRRELLARAWRCPEILDRQTPSEAGEALFNMLERLAPRDRLVLTLYYFEKCDTKEISERTGWSVVLVRVQMHRACRKLKRMLTEAGYGKTQHG
jgi:RNA polymerase sigma-70 factor (ECF subfamily)